MTVPEALAALERFRLAHAAEVDAWAVRRHAEIHAMSVARTRGLGQMARHIRVKLLANSNVIVSISDPDALAIYSIRAARELVDILGAIYAPAIYHL